MCCSVSRATVFMLEEIDCGVPDVFICIYVSLVVGIHTVFSLGRSCSRPFLDCLTCEKPTRVV